MPPRGSSYTWRRAFPLGRARSAGRAGQPERLAAHGSRRARSRPHTHTTQTHKPSPPSTRHTRRGDQKKKRRSVEGTHDDTNPRINFGRPTEAKPSLIVVLHTKNPVKGDEILRAPSSGSLVLAGGLPGYPGALHSPFPSHVSEITSAPPARVPTGASRPVKRICLREIAAGKK